MHFMSISSYNLHINCLSPDLNPYSARISGPSGIATLEPVTKANILDRATADLGQNDDTTGWCPPVISGFINPINYSYICHKP